MSVFKWFRSLISFHKYQKTLESRLIPHDIQKNQQIRKYWETDYTNGMLYVTDKDSGKIGLTPHYGMIVYQNKKYYVIKKEGLCITAMAEEVDKEYENLHNHLTK